MGHALDAMRYLAPQLIVALTGGLVLVADLVWIRPGRREHPGRPWLAWIGIAGLLAAGLATTALDLPASPLLSGTIVIDPLTRFLDLVFILVAVVVLALSVDVVSRFTEWVAEYYAMIIWCTLGNMLVGAASELFTLFVCFQLTSIPLIALIGSAQRDERSREAGLKYLLLVLVSTALFLYGLSLVYGSLGTSHMSGIAARSAQAGTPPLAAIGLVLMVVGFAFKITAVPFQHWVPDVYEGAPAAVTAFLSVGSKLAGFAVALRFIVTGLEAVGSLQVVLAVLAAASMTVGNLGALRQGNIKRLLAYSGIAQAGYILVGLAAVSATGVAALLFYLAAYGVANLLAFAVVIAFFDAVGSENVSDYAGLARRSPLAAFALAASLLSLAGLPLTVGFMAKLSVFLSAAQAGLFWLVLVAVVNTVMAFYYYLRIIWVLYVPETGHSRIWIAPRHAAVMVVCSAGVALVGVLPAPLLSATDHAARTLFGL